jgi:hypothetical protein
LNHANGVTVEAKPNWIDQPQGQITTQGFKDDVVRSLRAVGGGAYGNILIAPNTLNPYTSVISRLTQIEGNRFIQECL